MRAPPLNKKFHEYITIIDNHKLYYEDEIDIKYSNFLSPVIMLPLICFSKEYNKKIKNHPIDKVNDYKNRVLGYEQHNDTTLPFREIKKDNSIELTESLFNILNNIEIGENSFKFIFHELLGNVYDHSQFRRGYVLGQTFPNVGIADICFMDNGLGISGSFKAAGYSFKNDCTAILEAINGHSSKGKYDASFQRGFGLNNTINLITNGGVMGQF